MDYSHTQTSLGEAYSYLKPNEESLQEFSLPLQVNILQGLLPSNIVSPALKDNLITIENKFDKKQEIVKLDKYKIINRTAYVDNATNATGHIQLQTVGWVPFKSLVIKIPVGLTTDGPYFPQIAAIAQPIYWILNLLANYKLKINNYEIEVPEYRSDIPNFLATKILLAKRLKTHNEVLHFYSNFGLPYQCNMNTLQTTIPTDLAGITFSRPPHNIGFEEDSYNNKYNMGLLSQSNSRYTTLMLPLHFLYPMLNVDKLFPPGTPIRFDYNLQGVTLRGSYSPFDATRIAIGPDLEKMSIEYLTYDITDKNNEIFFSILNSTPISWNFTSCEIKKLSLFRTSRDPSVFTFKFAKDEIRGSPDSIILLPFTQSQLDFDPYGVSYQNQIHVEQNNIMPFKVISYLIYGYDNQQNLFCRSACKTYEEKLEKLYDEKSIANNKKIIIAQNNTNNIYHTNGYEIFLTRNNKTLLQLVDMDIYIDLNIITYQTSSPSTYNPSNIIYALLKYNNYRTTWDQRNGVLKITSSVWPLQPNI